MTGKSKLKFQSSRCLAAKSKFKTGLALLILSVFVGLFGGCKSSVEGEIATTPQITAVVETPAAQKKAELARKINRRFENPDAHFELGKLYHAEGSWSNAEYHYDIAVRFDPVLWDAQAAIVKLHIDSGNTAKAKSSADTYINQVSDSGEDLSKLALAFQKQGLDEYALACFKQALQVAPNSAEVNKQLGYYYLSRDDKAQAKDYFIRSFNIDRNQPDVARELGRLNVEIRIPRQTEIRTNKPDTVIEQLEKESSGS